jgi:hypothetical protein
MAEKPSAQNRAGTDKSLLALLDSQPCRKKLLGRL